MQDNPYKSPETSNSKSSGKLSRWSYLRVNVTAALLLMLLMVVPLAYIFASVWVRNDLGGRRYASYDAEFEFAIDPVGFTVVLLIFFGIPNLTVFLLRRFSRIRY